MPMSDERLVEVVWQKEKQWGDRTFISPTKIPELIATRPDCAWFATTFALHTDEVVDSDTAPQQFKTMYKSGDLFFDFDSNTIERASEDCRSVYKYLVDSLHIEEEQIHLYYSGKKGYHLIVNWKVTGLEPRTDLHTLYQRFVSGISHEIAKNGTLDLKVYNARRLLRIPSTVHQSTKRKKVRISVENLLESNTEALKGIPDTPFPFTDVSLHLRDAFRRHQIAETSQLIAKKRIPKQFLDDPLDCIKHATEFGLSEGERNDGAYTIALYYKALGLTKKEIQKKLQESALCTISGMQKLEAQTTATSAYNSENKFGLKGNVLEPYITEKDWERWRSVKLDESYVSLKEVVNNIEEDFNKEGGGTLAKYYVPVLDEKLGGIDGSELIILGGSTGTGKSEFALHVAIENAKAGVPTALVTLELSNEMLIKRVVRARAGISPEVFAKGSFTDEQKKAIDDACEEIKTEEIPLFMRTKRGEITTDELEALVSSLIVEQNCRLIVLDHLHYMGGRNSFDKENTHVATCIRDINTLCQKYNVGMICIAHFKKFPNAEHRASIHEFKDSSAIEQEASTILIMRRNLTGKGDEQLTTEFTLGKTRKDLVLFNVKTKFNKKTRGYDRK